ncbi:unnamed protein product [Alopecurus aequalis]
MAISKDLVLAILGCLCFFSFVLAARELSDDLSMAARHESWMTQYVLVYKDGAEKVQRLQVFNANVEFIESFNAANRKFYLGVNQCADITNEEFKASRAHKGYKPSSERVPTTFRYENVSLDALPVTVDWRTKGAVTPVKDQGQCDGKCRSRSNSAATIKSYEDVPANNEGALMAAVASQPVSVAVDGGDMTFQFYKGGVMTGSCGTDLDHGIAAIGYGTTSDGTKYWLLKNSWGTTWGENGFLRMEKDISDKKGMCGLAMEPSYPTE